MELPKINFLILLCARNFTAIVLFSNCDTHTVVCELYYLVLTNIFYDLPFSAQVECFISCAFISHGVQRLSFVE